MNPHQEQEPKLRRISLESYRLGQLDSSLLKLNYALSHMEFAAETEPAFSHPSAPVEEATPLDHLTALRQQIKREAA